VIVGWNGPASLNDSDGVVVMSHSRRNQELHKSLIGQSVPHALCAFRPVIRQRPVERLWLIYGPYNGNET
jgi:hypothetical protein